MTAIVKDIVIDAGATRPDIIFRLPIDSTGSVWALILRKPDGAIVKIDTPEEGLTVEIFPKGQPRTDITWRRSEAEALALPTYYEVWQTEPGGGKRPWVRGDIKGVGHGLGATP